MGCLCSNVIDKSASDLLDYFPADSEFEYLRPRGHIIVKIDEMFLVPVVILDFDKCAPKYVRLLPYEHLNRQPFVYLDRTPLPSPVLSENSEHDSSYDTVF